MKKSLCAMLALLLCIVSAFAVLPASAAGSAYPESAHPYENGVTDVQSYTDESADRGLFVTFSEDTRVEPFSTIWIPIPDPKFTVVDLVSGTVRSGDYISILDADNNALYTFTGDELAGRTVYVPGNTFRVLLKADAEANDYGYRITEVRPAAKDEVGSVTYRNGGAKETVYAPKNGAGEFRERCVINGVTQKSENAAFSGWAAVPGGDPVYDPGDPIPAAAGDIEVWAAWTPLCLGPKEVLSFSNSAWDFEDEGRENYYMNAEDYRAMQLDLYKNFGLGPVPGPVISAVLSKYPDWEWQGSCYGMSTAVALQHFGIADLLSLQPEAETVYDLEPDDALISRINFYQAQAASSWLTENKAYNKGTPLYTAQLKRMFESVKQGNLVMFTFYEDQPFITGGHTVLFTGAYTRANGAHVLVCYDCNSPYSYYSGRYSTWFEISPDFTSVTDDWDDELGGFNWTDRFDQFESFSPDVKQGSPLTWYKALLRHLVSFIGVIKAMFSR